MASDLLDTHILRAIDLELSAKETFYVARIITLARLDLDERYTGTMEFTRSMIHAGEGMTEDMVNKYLCNINQLRSEGLAELVVLKELEARLWEKINGC